MVLLCAGVIIAGSTWHGFADSYNVTAHVDDVPVTVPAPITQPADQLHTTDSQIDISGTCPVPSYVKVFRDGQLAGVSACTSAAFAVRIDLAMAANHIQAKVYNMTNSEGPASSPVTIYRDALPVAPTVPLYVPTTLQLDTVERGDYNPGSTPRTSTNPTVSGFAPPYSDIVVTYHSDPVTCRTKADGAGWWTCTLNESLPGGTHHVDIGARTPEGAWLALPTFEIVVLPPLPSLVPQLSPLPVVNVDFRYQTHYPGQPFSWTLDLKGGNPPFKVTVNWGDGSESTYIRADGNPFTITHAFPQNQTYTVFVKSMDTDGTPSLMQLFAIVKAKDGAMGVSATKPPGPIITLLAMLQRYLWIVWPAYIAVILMVFSYWLGEKEMYRHFMMRRVAHHGGGKGRRL